MVFVRFQRFSICLLLSLTRSFLIIWTRWTTGGLKNAIFTETKQTINNKKENNFDEWYFSSFVQF